MEQNINPFKEKIKFSSNKNCTKEGTFVQYVFVAGAHHTAMFFT